MPRPTNFVAFIRNVVREQVHGSRACSAQREARRRRRPTDDGEGGVGVGDRDCRGDRRLGSGGTTGGIPEERIS